MNDITTREDIQRLVNAFYDKVNKDEFIGPVFAHVHWPDHLPTMYSFWGSMLLGEATYRGNPLQRHLHLNIGSEHFGVWLKLWHETIDELFTGAVADDAKMRGNSIAEVFQYRMGLKKQI